MSRRHIQTLLLTLLAFCGRLPADTNTPAPGKLVFLDGKITTLRPARVDQTFADEITAAFAATNKTIGTILDLRFNAEGDTAAVRTTANLLAAKKMPLAILVNSQTHGAAAALATTLRAMKRGLIFGGTPGEVKPDIQITVSPEDERAYFADPCANPRHTSPANSTNPPPSQTNSPIRRISEADLVRARRAGAADPEDELENTPAPAPAEKPSLRDPALLRAADLLEGLSTLHHSP